MAALIFYLICILILFPIFTSNSAFRISIVEYFIRIRSFVHVHLGMIFIDVGLSVLCETIR